MYVPDLDGDIGVDLLELAFTLTRDIESERRPSQHSTENFRVST